MPDYQLAKIYKLTCDNPDLVYYGATTQKYLCDRLAKHKHISNKSVSKILFKAGNVKIELLEKCPCNDKDELNAREAFYIRNNPCVNKQIPGRTKKEYREKQKEYINGIIKCECGCMSSRSNLKRHMKSEKHKKLLIKNAEQATN